MKTINDFTNLYQVSKTLRFELVPQGKTEEYIRTRGLLDQDKQRAEDYQEVKKIIDKYHQDFIEEALHGLQLSELDKYKELYGIREKTGNQYKDFERLKKTLRKQIADTFTKDERIIEKYKRLFQKELIKEDLQKWCVDQRDKELIAKFAKFTTYFTGFHKNRKNIYTSEGKSTAIAYRIIHVNLPKCLDNIRVFVKIKDLPVLPIWEKELKSLMQFESLNDFFSLDNFNKCLTQKGIEAYNNVLGGKSEGQKKIKGLNEYINLYRQGNNIKSKDLPNLKPLYKQILSDRSSISWLPETFEDDTTLLDTIRNFYNEQLEEYELNGQIVNVLHQFKALMDQINESNAEQIFIRNDDEALTYISQRLFGERNMIHCALEYYYTAFVNKPKQNRKGEFVLSKEYQKNRSIWMEKNKYHSISIVEAALNAYKNENEGLKERVLDNNFSNCLTNFSFKDKFNNEKNLIISIENTYKDAEELLNTQYTGNLVQDENNVKIIKKLLDAIQDLHRFVKVLHPKDLEGAKDEGFYATYIALYDQINGIVPLYNSVRNYLTRKPYKTDKYKLNFENSTLLEGWDKNKEKDYTSVLLRKNGLYFLAIMPQKHKKAFNNPPALKGNEHFYEKMDYKQVPDRTGFGGFVRKCYGTASKRGWVCPENCKNNEGKIIISDKEVVDNRVDLINSFRNFLDVYENEGFQYKDFGFKFKESNEYENLRQFFLDVEQQGYKITFQNISEKYVDQLVEKGELYMFKIYNKDFSTASKGRSNLHTMYWKILFDEINLKDVVYKLNGKAEIFFRNSSIKSENRVIHNKNEAIANKNPYNHKKESKFNYDIIKDKRYTTDKYQFHVPITLNFKAKEINNINSNVREYLKNNPSVNIIGIDRGERHLLYLTLIDQQGNILKQISLNEIINSYQKDGKNIDVKTNYQEKLNQKEVERSKARVDWGTIVNIKELKEGYLSHVVHVIAKMMVEYSAIVVMEDLNIGFKRGRQKVEKQVYQKFEKMLIDKLNYLVFKEKNIDEAGGMLKALQLANKFESFKKLGKQSGFIFYVPAALTSKIDPETGFVDFLKPKYENKEKAKDFFRKFESIRYVNERFEFAFDYKKFVGSYDFGKSDWVVCSNNVSRFRWNLKLNNGKGAQEEVKVTEAMESHFRNAGISFLSGSDLKEQIIEQNDAKFYEILMRLLAVLLSLRHNNGKKDADEMDFILSPVYPFFNSSNAPDDKPQNADANGAYNIALKGLLLMEKFNRAENLDEIEIKVSNKEWLDFIQTKWCGQK